MAKVALIIIMTFNACGLLIAGSNLGKELTKSKNQEIEISYLDFLPKEINNQILLLAKIQEFKKNSELQQYLYFSNDGLYLVDEEFYGSYEPQRIATIPHYIIILGFRRSLKNTMIIFFRYSDSYANRRIKYSDFYEHRRSKFKFGFNIFKRSHTGDFMKEAVMFDETCFDRLRDFKTNAAGTAIYALEDRKFVIREKINDEWFKRNPITVPENIKEINYLEEFNALTFFDESGNTRLHFLEKPDFSQNLMKKYLNQNQR